MPYTLPTTDQFLARFPIFGDSDESQIAALITEASSKVDKTWLENDYQPAIMYLAAHLLATDNSQDGDTPEIGSRIGGIQSESFSGMSQGYAVSPSTGTLFSSDAYGSTEYGRRYLQLLRMNRGGPVVA